MIYKFKSKAGADVIMLGPNGDQLLGLIGKPAAAQGIIEPADLPSSIGALQAAIAAEDARTAASPGGAGTASAPDRVSLRQRAWPLIELMRQASAANEPILWGL
jgi:hypothetical protein